MRNLTTSCSAAVSFFLAVASISSTSLSAQGTPIRYLDVGFQETSILDVHYGQNHNPWTNRQENLYLDVYYPWQDTETKRPCFLYVHGGEFYYGSKRGGEVVGPCKWLAYRGWVTVAMDYRLATSANHGGYGPNVAAEDVKAAIRYMKVHANQFGIDPNRIVVAGDSVGGLIVQLIGYQDWEGNSGNPQVDSKVSAVINMWGWHVTAIDKPRTALYSVHGTHDAVTPYQLALNMHAEANRNGVTNELITLHGEGHSPYHRWAEFSAPLISNLYERLGLAEHSGACVSPGYSAGGNLTMHLTGFQGDTATLYVSPIATQIPVQGLGTWFIDPHTALLMKQVQFNAARTTTISTSYPLLPEFQGQTVFWQAGYTRNGLPLRFSNPLATTF